MSTRTFLALGACIVSLSMAFGCDDSCEKQCRYDYTACIESGMPRADCKADFEACKADCERGDDCTEDVCGDSGAGSDPEY